MFENITIGQYYPGQSLVHRLDPRTKINGVVAIILAVFLARQGVAYLIVTAFLSAIVLNAKIPVRYLLKGLRPILFIGSLTFLIHLFVTSGTVIYQIGPLRITEEGLRQGSFLVWRLIMLVLTTSMLTLTTPPVTLTDGLERVLKPYKRIGVPAHELAMMMTIALRFIPTLIEETGKIMKAQMARGADFESGNIFQRAKNLIPLLVPLFVSAFRRADELAVAMEARCYQGGDKRTRLKQLSYQSIDAGGYFAVFATVGLVVWLRYFGA
jgi:energy-coupling factor transport system permease protein